MFGTNFAGVSTTGNLPTVIELDGALQNYPRRYFTVDKGMSEEQANQDISRFPNGTVSSTGHIAMLL